MQHRTGATLKSAPVSAPRLMVRGQAVADKASYYIFNTAGDQGYIIISGDDRTNKVLGYVDKGSFDPNHVPANMQAWLDSYNEQIGMLDALG